MDGPTTPPRPGSVPWRRRLRAAVGPLVAAATGVGALLALVYLTMSRTGNQAWFYFTEPAGVAHASPLIGVVAVAGVVGWLVAATVALFAARTAVHAPHDERRLLVVLGLASAALAIDDHFMLHEHVLPDLLGLSPVVLVGLYGLGALLAARVVGRAVAAHEDAPILLAAVAGLGLSVLIDGLADLGVIAETSFEDVPKLFGIAAWALFCWRGSVHATAASTEREDRPAPPDPDRFGTR